MLADTGPLVALFDRTDARHGRCVAALRAIREPLWTTVPVLTEAFHVLQPASASSDRLREFVAKGGVRTWFLDAATLDRSFELMEIYRDHPMDLADASIVAAAEKLGTRKVFSLDRRDFMTYRVRRGHRHLTMQIIG